MAKENNKKKKVGIYDIVDLDNSANNPIALIEPYQSSQQIISVATWKRAVAAAQNVDSPSRSLLYDTYDNAMLDLHLSGIIESRILKIQQAEFKIINATGKDNPELKKLFQQMWFLEYLKYAMESIFWGHSLIQFGSMIEGKIQDVELVERRNVIPEKTLIVKTIGDEKGWNYIDDFYYECTPVGSAKGLGMLKKIALFAIFKKFAISTWSEYNETMGIPFRSIKTSNNNPKYLATLNQILKQMGSAGYGVLQDTDVLEFYNAKTQGAQEVFDKLIERMNSEMSKAVLGQTMTTEDGSSLAQAKVHSEVAEDRHFADKVFMQYSINDQLLPRLIAYYPQLAGYSFAWDEMAELGVSELIESVTKLAPYYDIDVDYLSKRTGIPLSVKKQQQPNLTMKALDRIRSFQKKDNPNPTLNHNIHPDINLPDYSDLCNCPSCNDFRMITTDEFVKIQDSLSELAYDDKGQTEFSHEYYDKLTKKLQETFNDNFTKQLDNVDYNAPDHVAKVMMQANIFKFAAAKDVAMLLELNQVAKESKSYQEFQKSIKNNTLLKNINREYLKTEFINTQLTATNASRYYNQLSQKDVLTHWLYQTVGDNNVREAHKGLDGMILPADDKAWATIYPPNGWRCRCEVIAIEKPTDESKISKSGDEEQRLGSKELSKMKKQGFATNRAKLMEVFSDSQQYIKSFDISKLSYKQYGLPNIDDIQKTIKEKFTPDNTTPKKALELFDTWTNKNDMAGSDKARLIGFNNIPFILEKDTLINHFTPKYEAEKRYNLLKSLPEVLKEPNEVYFLQKSKQGGNTFNLFKHFNNDVYQVAFSFETNELKIKTFFITKKEKINSYRNGILIHKKKQK